VIVSVDLTTTPAEVRLDEPDDCKRFHVAVRGAADAASLADALAAHAVGRTDGDDALVEIEALRRLAAGRVSGAWEADFAAMVEFARTKGWLDATERAIQAHVEWA
jgi:hypothetical protein